MRIQVSSQNDDPTDPAEVGKRPSVFSQMDQALPVMVRHCQSAVRYAQLMSIS